jgi:predicted outer membrane repeat protein
MQHAIKVEADATGAYAAPAVLTNLQLTGNKGSLGSALLVGPAVSVILQNVSVFNNAAQQGAIFADNSSNIVVNNSMLSGNTGILGKCTEPGCVNGNLSPASIGSLGSALLVGSGAFAELQSTLIDANTGDFGVVFAGHRSSLTITNCSITNNTGPAVISAGSVFNVSHSRFVGNRARFTPPNVVSKAGVTGGGGAVQLLCLLQTPGGCDMVASVTDSSFSNNNGTNGGALYCGWRSTVQLRAVTFLGNSALEGGAVYADSDSCLGSMVDTTFTLNSAQER